MAVHRERVDPPSDVQSESLVHRRWLLPDELGREVALPQLARLWRGLVDLAVLDESSEVRVERVTLPPTAERTGPVALGEPTRQDMPARVSAGALLAAGGAAMLLTQVVRLSEGRRDPYATDDEGAWRDYTLYAVTQPGWLLLPIAPMSLTCAECGAAHVPALPRFGEGWLLDLAVPCGACNAATDPERDRVMLRSGAVFLLAEASCRAALSIELPRAPEEEELPDAAVSALLRETLGSHDELADDGVPPAE